MRKPPSERFWSNVDIKEVNDCWGWTKFKNKDGYGRVWFNNRSNLSHRIAYQLSHPNENIKNQVVRHKCDNPPCCNPYHLELGTIVEDVRDRVDRNRTSCGESHYSSKLTDKNALDIRDMHKNYKYSIICLVKIYNVNPSTIRYILEGKRRSLGINQENLLIGKNRTLRGENNPNSKLNKRDIIEIRELFKNGCKQSTIAKKFGVCDTTISNVLKNRTYIKEQIC